MKVLAMEPYYGGSHRSFIDDWISLSRHDWTLLNLPPHGWKWRMRQSAAGFAKEVQSLYSRGNRWDVIFATDMVNLAEFCGLVPPEVAKLPRIIYFHENQFVYPTGYEARWDAHFSLSNMYSALAADEAWWNSAYNRDSFLASLDEFLKKMRKPRLGWASESIAAISGIEYPGVNLPDHESRRKPGPLRIIWPARWEHDKSPEIFFEAVEKLAQAGRDFRLLVTGEDFRDRPAVFDKSRRSLDSFIEHWGFIPDREAFYDTLRQADIVVSTSGQEFFGIAMVEAAAAGPMPLLPDKLVYPEIFGLSSDPGKREFFYNGSAVDLAGRLVELADACRDGNPPARNARRVANLDRFDRTRRSAEMDEHLRETVAETSRRKRH